MAPKLSRRQLFGLAGGSAASLVLAACSSEKEPGESLQGTTTSPNKSPASMTWFEPEVLSSRDGILDTTLSLAPGIVPDGASSRWALTVNGTTPGPTLRVKPGDRLRIVLDNRTQHATNLHTHGLHVSPSKNADNPFLEIAPGQHFTYEIDIPKDHRGGLHWYHPHLHHNVAEQLFSGFFGAIIVEDEFDRRPDIADARERLVLIHDARAGATESSVTGTSMVDRMMGREGSVVLINGGRVPELATITGKLERWRILNASASRFYNLRLAGHTFQVIGGDGGRLSVPRQMDSLSLVPGERREVLVQPTKAGTYALSTSSVGRGSLGMGGGGGGSVISGSAGLLSMVVSGDQSAEARLPELPKSPGDDRQARIDRTREVTFSMQGMNFFIDGRAFSGDRIDIRASLGTTEEWTIRNLSTMDHPFHIHVWPFQVVAQSSGSPPDGWKDVVNVPAGGWVRLHIPFADIPGKTVYHCHILDHEDLGMMGVIEVT